MSSICRQMVRCLMLWQIRTFLTDDPLYANCSFAYEMVMRFFPIVGHFWANDSLSNDLARQKVRTDGPL